MNRRATVMVALAAVAVVALWYLLLWGPRTRDLGQARKRSEDAAREQSELANRIERLKAAQAAEPRLRARLEDLRTAVPDEPNLGQFILDANDAATRSGIEFISIAPGMPQAAGGQGQATTATAPPPVSGSPAPAAGAGLPGAQPGPPAQIPLNLQISGGYFQVLDFLNRLDDLPRLVVTDGLNVNSDERAQLTVSVTARMFVRSVPPAYAAPVGGAGGAGTGAGSASATTPTTVSPPTTSPAPTAARS